MNDDFNREWLSAKFEEIRRRTLKALEQLNDEQVNWRPDPVSLSIAALIKHIEGNVQERIAAGILRQEIRRSREEELNPGYITKSELEFIVQDRVGMVIETVKRMTCEQLAETQTVRNRERTHLDMLHQCAAHYSEHMGQIFYIAKQLLKDDYRSTSI